MSLRDLAKVLFTLTAGALLVGAAPLPAQSDREADRQEVGQLLSEWEHAWNSHDMRKLAALFTEDAVWVLWTGEVWTGRARFEAGMIDVHRTIFRNSVQREQLEELTFVGPDAAVVRFQSSLTGDSRWPDRIVRSRKILVLTQGKDGWRVAWGQNTRFRDDMAPTPTEQ